MAGEERWLTNPARPTTSITGAGTGLDRHRFGLAPPPDSSISMRLRVLAVDLIISHV